MHLLPARKQEDHSAGHLRGPRPRTYQRCPMLWRVLGKQFLILGSQTRLGTEAVQPGEQSEIIGDVSRSAAQSLPAGEQHLGVLGLSVAVAAMQPA